MICTCDPELRPNSAVKLLLIRFTSWTESRLKVPVPDEPVVEISVAVTPSTVMLLPRPREPLELKLPDPRKGLSFVTGTTPADKVASWTGSRVCNGRSTTSLESIDWLIWDVATSRRGAAPPSTLTTSVGEPTC